MSIDPPNPHKSPLSSPKTPPKTPKPRSHQGKTPKPEHQTTAPTRSKSHRRHCTPSHSSQRSRPQSYTTRNNQATHAGRQIIALALRDANETEIVTQASRHFYKNHHQTIIETLAPGCSIASLRRFRRGERVRRFAEYCQALHLDPQIISGQTTQPALLPELSHTGSDRVTAAKHTACLGRDAELSQIETILRSGSIRLYLQGARGIGKTTLADEIANTIAPKLGIARRITIAIKPYDNLGTRQIPRWRVQRSLDRIERELTYACSPTLGYDAIQLPRDVLFTRLAEKQTLLVIDDLDCAEDLDAVLGLVYGLPPSVQIVMTGSVGLDIERILRLAPLNDTAIAQLIDHCCTDRQLTMPANDRCWLQETSRGFPATVIKAVALLAESGEFSKPSILDLRDTCLQSYIQLALDRLDATARTVAAILSLFPQPPTLEAIAEIAALNSIDQADLVAIVTRLDQLNLAHYNTTQQTCGASRLERESLAQVLQTHPDRDAIYQRWIDRYRRLAAHLQPDDWKVWQDYTPIDREWENWLMALEWCIAQQRFEPACDLWAGLRGYTNLRGYWQERLRWLEWAIAMAEDRRDSLAQARFWRDRAWTLALTEDPAQRQQAEFCFQNALQLAQSAQVGSCPTAPPQGHSQQGRQSWQSWQNQQSWQEFHSELALEYAVLCLEKGDLEAAQTWITQERAQIQRLLTQAQTTASRSQWQRQSLRADYYEAEVLFNRQEYARARETYCQVLQRARDLGWDQLCAYATNWLADIALCEQSFETAETWLKQTQRYLEGQQDSRSLGFYHQSLARAYAGRAHYSAADASARRAANAFTQVGLFDRARTLVDEFQLA